MIFIINITKKQFKISNILCYYIINSSIIFKYIKIKNIYSLSQINLYYLKLYLYLWILTQIVNKNNLWLNTFFINKYRLWWFYKYKKI